MTKISVKETSLLLFIAVSLQYCAGNCRSATRYLHEYPYFKSICRCCKAVYVKAKLIDLECPVEEGTADSKTMVVERNVAVKCSCRVCQTKKKRK